MEGHVRFAQLINGLGQYALLFMKFVPGKRLDIIRKKDSLFDHVQKTLQE
jgi:hypothetical protein